MHRKLFQRLFFSITQASPSLIQSLKSGTLGKLLFLIIFLATPGFSNSPAKLRHVYLTWQHDPCHTMTVNVHGIRTPSVLTVYYDKKAHFSQLSEYPFKVSGKGECPIKLPDGRRLYHIELRDLDPDEVYYFTIGDDFHAYGKEMSFHTIPEDEKAPLRFVEGGDWENTPEAETLAVQAASMNPHATLLGGDYPSLVLGLRDFAQWDSWLDAYARTMVTSEGCLIPMVMALGNHEVIGGFGQTKDQVPFFLHYFRQGEKSYFSLPFGKKMQLFVLDSGHATPHGGEQSSWLAEELQRAKDLPVKIALYHVPLFPSLRFVEKDLIYRSLHGIVELWKDKSSADKLFSRESALGKQHWLPLFDQYTLTVAFEHHDQALKRTKLIRYGKEDKEGTLYLGDGGWGSALQYPPIQGYFHTYFNELKGKVHFFWFVEINQNEIRYEAISSSGKVLDHYIQQIRSLS